jgi:hypothetical protein
MNAELMQIFEDFFTGRVGEAGAVSRIIEYFKIPGLLPPIEPGSTLEFDASKEAQRTFNRMVQNGQPTDWFVETLENRGTLEDFKARVALAGPGGRATTAFDSYDPFSPEPQILPGSDPFALANVFGSEIERPLADIYRQEAQASPFARFLPQAALTRGRRSAEAQFDLQGAGFPGTAYGVPGAERPREASYRTFLQQGTPYRGEALLDRLNRISTILGKMEADPSLGGMTEGPTPIDAALADRYIDPGQQFEAFLQPFEQRTSPQARSGMQNYFQRVFDLFQKEHPQDPNFLRFALNKFGSFLRDSPEVLKQREARQAAFSARPAWTSGFAGYS